MDTVTLKGYTLAPFDMKGSSPRRALQFKNSIIATLKKIGVHEDDIDVSLESVVIKKAPASVSWYFNDRHLYFSYKLSRFIENLYVVTQVIEREVEALLSGIRTEDE